MAASTGMRQGEIQRLQHKYIHKYHIEVKPAWEEGYGSIAPKTNETRVEPVPETVSKILDESPFKEPGDFLFHGKTHNKPLDKKLFEGTFKRVLKAIGIEEEERRERNITFHSWQHFVNTLCWLGQVPDRKL